MDIDKLISILRDGKYLPERDIRLVCEKAKEILIEESNVQPVRAPVTICGDIHGQYCDLLEIFKIGGDVPDTDYIFLGDYVDRGYNSVETFQLLLCLKVRYPGHITLLRGNHECKNLSMVYGFFDEVLRKYGNDNPWKYCIDVFEYLPIGAILEGSILCIHGGLSPDIKTLDQIRNIDRVTEIPCEGGFCDLVWSDPADDVDRWQESPRGAGWLFGRMITKEFNYINKIELITRSHQLEPEGYKYWFKERNLVTVWSAPDHRRHTLGSLMNVNEDLQQKFQIFSSVS